MSQEKEKERNNSESVSTQNLDESDYEDCMDFELPRDNETPSNSVIFHSFKSNENDSPMRINESFIANSKPQIHNKNFFQDNIQSDEGSNKNLVDTPNKQDTNTLDQIKDTNATDEEKISRSSQNSSNERDLNVNITLNINDALGSSTNNTADDNEPFRGSENDSKGKSADTKIIAADDLNVPTTATTTEQNETTKAAKTKNFSFKHKINCKNKSKEEKNADRLSVSSDDEPSFNIYHAAVGPDCRSRGFFKTKALYDDIDDLTPEELKELTELAKYNNILNDKFVDSFPKRDKFKSWREIKQDSEETPKPEPQTNTEEANTPAPKVDTNPESITSSSDESDSPTLDVRLPEAPEGILKKGTHNRSKVTLAVNFAEKPDIVSDSMLSDASTVEESDETLTPDEDSKVQNYILDYIDRLDQNEIDHHPYIQTTYLEESLSDGSMEYEMLTERSKFYPKTDSWDGFSDASKEDQESADSDREFLYQLLQETTFAEEKSSDGVKIKEIESNEKIEEGVHSAKVDVSVPHVENATPKFYDNVYATNILSSKLDTLINIAQEQSEYLTKATEAFKRLTTASNTEVEKQLQDMELQEPVLQQQSSSKVKSSPIAPNGASQTKSETTLEQKSQKDSSETKISEYSDSLESPDLSKTSISRNDIETNLELIEKKTDAIRENIDVLQKDIKVEYENFAAIIKGMTVTKPLSSDCESSEMQREVHDQEKERGVEEKEPRKENEQTAHDKPLEDAAEIEEQRKRIFDNMVEEMQCKWNENERKIEEVLKEASERENSQPTTSQEDLGIEENFLLSEREANSIFKNIDTKRNASHVEITEEQIKKMYEEMEENLKSKSSLKQIKKTANDVIRHIEENLENYQHQLSAEYLNNSPDASQSSKTQIYKTIYHGLQASKSLEVRSNDTLDRLDDSDKKADSLKRTKGSLYLKEQMALITPDSSCCSNLCQEPPTLKSISEKNITKKRQQNEFPHVQSEHTSKVNQEVKDYIQKLQDDLQYHSQQNNISEEGPTITIVVPEVTETFTSPSEVGEKVTGEPSESKKQTEATDKDELSKEIDDLVMKLKNGLRTSEARTAEPKKELNFSVNFSPGAVFDVFDMYEEDSLSPTPSSPSQLSNHSQHSFNINVVTNKTQSAKNISSPPNFLKTLSEEEHVGSLSSDSSTPSRSSNQRMFPQPFNINVVSPELKSSSEDSDSPKSDDLSSSDDSKSSLSLKVNTDKTDSRSLSISSRSETLKITEDPLSTESTSNISPPKASNIGAVPSNDSECHTSASRPSSPSNHSKILKLRREERDDEGDTILTVEVTNISPPSTHSKTLRISKSDSMHSDESERFRDMLAKEGQNMERKNDGGSGSPTGINEEGNEDSSFIGRADFISANVTVHHRK